MQISSNETNLRNQSNRLTVCAAKALNKVNHLFIFKFGGWEVQARKDGGGLSCLNFRQPLALLFPECQRVPWWIWLLAFVHFLSMYSVPVYMHFFSIFIHKPNREWKCFIAACNSWTQVRFNYAIQKFRWQGSELR